MAHGHWMSVRLTCGDGRLEQTILDFVHSLGGLSDPVPAPGGVKKFLLDESYRQKVLEDIGTYVGLHHPAKLVVLQHEDCGAYGHSSAFQSREEEEEYHRQELTRAFPMFREAFPGLGIVSGYVKKTDDSGEHWKVVPVPPP